jgi:L-lactate dehydrogenase (cytochrome)
MAGLYARRGEKQAARAALEAGVPMCLSTLSICGIEEIAGVEPPWFQLYMLKDRGFMRELMARAEAAKCPALVFTVDLPVPGARYRDARNGLFGGGAGAQLRALADGALHPGWVWDVWFNGGSRAFANVAPAVGTKASFADFWVWVRKNFDPAISWKDIDWIRETWRGPIILKGILDAEDAELACKSGIDGIVVSNHGGRQLDGGLSSVRALPAVVEQVAGRVPVLMDGGVRSGLDVLRAMALGASGCLIGRNWAFALAARGQRGIAAMLTTMRAELTTAMALTGCVNVQEAGRELLA